MKIKLKPKGREQSYTIQAIYDRHGGTRAAARKCGYSAELLSGWKIQGYVPLKKVAEIAVKLDCQPYELNREGVIELTDVVKTAELKLVK